jgi:putative ABC transport system substrate-binding protein
MTIAITRREFAAAIGSAAAWPIAPRAQPAAMPVIGVLSALFARDAQPALAALRQGLLEAGYVQGQNFAIEYRWADTDYTRLPELAADLVRRRVSVIFASGGAVSARAAKAATQTIPIVFVVGADPVATGLVTSLNRPGGNVTGIAFLSNELGPKRLGLLNELVPGASRYALLVNPDAPGTEALTVEFRAASARMGKQMEVFTANRVGEIDSAFAELVRKGADALVVGSSSLLNRRSVQLATLASHYRIPAIYYDRHIVDVGGLMSYGANLDEADRQAGIYAGRILKGEKPADLPVMQTTKFEFVINLETAKTLGITVPPNVLALATDVIE